MAKIGFYIQKGNVNKKGFTPIRAVVPIESMNVSKSIGSVKPKHWNALKQRLHPSRADEQYNNFRETNETIDLFEQKTKEFFKSCFDNDIKLTASVVKKFFDGITVSDLKKQQEAPKIPKPDVWTAYDEFIEYSALTKAKKTAEDFRSSKKYLLRLEAETGTKISFETITLGFLDKWKDYHLKKRQLHWNYLATVVKRFKAFLNWSFERGYHDNITFKKFKVPEMPGTVITVTIDQFRKLYKHDFKTQKLDRVRDIFCFGCLSGLRISDLKRLTTDSIQQVDGKDYIVSYMEKVKKNKPLHIPLQPEARAIIEKYNDQYRLLPKISDQKFNDYIKEAALEAGLTAQVKVMSFATGTGVETMHPFNEIAHAHMTRKAFITISHERNIELQDIKEATGITSEKTLQRYITKDLNRLSKKFERLSGLLDD